MIDTPQHLSGETTVMAEQGGTVPSMNIIYEYMTLLDNNEEARLGDLPIGTPVPHMSVEAEVVEPTVTAPEANITNTSTTLLDNGEDFNQDDLPLKTIISHTSVAAETVQPFLATPDMNIMNVTATLLDDSKGSVDINTNFEKTGRMYQQSQSKYLIYVTLLRESKQWCCH
ncbi:hypothetical protein FIBSPDRAFT_900605 [Athelia psychrophila]|uniref:Uncharacterized protein n=1 Tax=Athelia psychrophila TaxID=1759441 RepID=A0A165Y892_9AGAM|nr:hypothetical protein FIBSPDRAFT_900605 [Fibularhizoctonia sp. CBS 109695]